MLNTREKLYTTIVVGTAREGRLSEKVARAIEEYLGNREGHIVTFADVKDYSFTKTEPGWEESDKAKPWRKIVQKSDAFIFVVPEYNRSFPGELKLLLDSESPKNYAKRAVALVGVSSGDYGGARALMSIQPVLSELGLVHTNYPLLIQGVNKLFDLNGRVSTERRDVFESKLLRMLEELEWYATLLKDGRSAGIQKKT